MHLTEENIEQYVKEEYSSNALLVQNAHINGFPMLLQRYYGGEMDCTLTCMTAIIYHLTKRKYKIADIYNDVESVAKKYFYKDTKGTPVVTIDEIFNEVADKYISKTTKVGYAKNIGYTLEVIKGQISKNNPMILSMNDDGLDYYKNHSVTVIGYKTYYVNNKEETMLKISDNWSSQISYLDYNKISFISSLHYLDNKNKNVFKIVVDLLKRLWSKIVDI